MQFRINVKGKITSWNDQAEKIFGWSKKEVLGISLNQFIVPKGKKSVYRKGLKRVLETGESHLLNQRIEIDVQHRDGHKFPVEIAITPVYSGKEIVSFSAFLRDLTERKKYETLQQAELSILEMIAQNKPQKDIFEQLCLAMEKQASKDAYASVLLVDKDKIHLNLGAAPSFSKKVQRALDGLTIGQCQGSFAAAVFRKAPVFVSNVQTDPLWVDFREFTKMHHIESCWSMPFFSETGEVLGSFALTQSVSAKPTKSDKRVMKVAAQLAVIAIERFQAHQSLITSDAKFSKALEVSPDAVVITRVADGKIIEANGACVELSGYKREELVGKTTLELNIYDADERERVVSILKKEGKFGNFESILRLKDGKVLNTLSSGVILEFKGEPCIFAIIHDITERKRTEVALKQSEQQFRNAFDHAPAGMAFVDVHRRVTRVNAEMCQLIGYEENELLGINFLDVTAEDGREESKRNFNKLMQGEITTIKLNKHYIHKKGHIIDVVLSVSVINDEDGKPHHLIALMDDVTLQKKAELKLVTSENRYRALYDGNPAMFFTINQDNLIDSANEFGADKLGYRVNELIGRSAMDIILSEDREDYLSHIEACFSKRHHINNWEIRKVKKNGSIIWSRESARVIDDGDGTQKILIVSEDITEAHKLSQRLSYQASHDALTGLVNRREFEIRLERLIHEDLSGGEEHALCYLDLDQFKIINDTCGHLAGDELLRQLGELFKSKVRKKDTLARLGGDEFGVLMENCSLEQAQRVAHDLRGLVEEFQFVWTDKRFSIGASVGLVPIDDRGGDAIDILSAADAACYAAKDAGRNRVHVYHAEDIDLAVRRGEMQWVSKINQALDEDRLCLYVQPIVSVLDKDEEKKHYECLVRMIDEDGKIIPPGAFLPAAERYNLSSKIDRWVFESAYAWLTKQPGKRKGLISCSVNVSGHSLSDESFLQFIVDKLDEGKILNSTICFEITETAAISRLSNAIRFMEVLKGKGCFFALDDFGSGVSSFGYLKNLPVDFLKIDGMFIRDMVDDPIDLAMVTSINEIGHVMGKKTIAEFVENQEIFDCLVELGVDFAQGYHVGKPRAIEVPVIKATDFKTANKKTKKKKNA